MREVKVFDESRKSFLERQQRIHEAELQRLEEEARATRMQRQLMKEDLANEAQGGRLYVSYRSCEPQMRRPGHWATVGLHFVLAALLLSRVQLDLRKNFMTCTYSLFTASCPGGPTRPGPSAPR